MLQIFLKGRPHSRPWIYREFTLAKKTSPMGFLFVVVIFVTVPGPDSEFGVANRLVGRPDGFSTMSAFVMLGLFQMMLRLPQSFQSSLHVDLVVIVVNVGSHSHGHAKQA
jgi:hypothetical protein